MNTPQYIPPVTLEEFKFKFKLTLGKMKKDTKIEYSVVQLHNQFKVVGLITKSLTSQHSQLILPLIFQEDLLNVTCLH